MLGDKERIKEIFGYSTATVIHSRVPIFQASRKVRGVSQWYGKTSWGSVEVTGRLGQVHRDLHDLIMTVGQEYRRGELGDLHIVIDPAEIQGLMGMKSDPRFLDRLLEDMRQAKVVLKYQDERASLGGIVSVVDKKYQEIPGPGGFMEKRMLWLVTISRTWVWVYDSYLRVRYAPALPIILQMKSGYSQAMARFFLTHRGHMSMKFDECLKILGINREPKLVKRDMKTLRNNMRKQGGCKLVRQGMESESDFALLEKIGILFEGEMVRYTQQPGLVNFDNPRKEKRGKKKT